MADKRLVAEGTLRDRRKIGRKGEREVDILTADEARDDESEDKEVGDKEAVLKIMKLEIMRMMKLSEK